MIIIALGANLESRYGTPIETLSAAKEAMRNYDIEIADQSRIWLTEPYPKGSDQPWYHNAVIAVKTKLSPEALMDVLLKIETEFGRVRGDANAPRILDLDIIAFNDQVVDEEGLKIPHERMHERLFVLNPLSDIHKNWVHPLKGQDVDQMIAQLNDDFETEALDESW